MIIVRWGEGGGVPLVCSQINLYSTSPVLDKDLMQASMLGRISQYTRLDQIITNWFVLRIAVLLYLVYYLKKYEWSRKKTLRCVRLAPS